MRSCWKVIGEVFEMMTKRICNKKYRALSYIFSLFACVGLGGGESYGRASLGEKKDKDLVHKIVPQAGKEHGKKDSKTSSDISENMADNPFFQSSTLPYQAPDFNAIKESDYLPAFQKGMKDHLKEIDQITRNKEKPNFENTLVALEKAGSLLNRVRAVFDGVYQANATAGLEALKTQIAPLLVQHDDAIFLNEALFARIKILYDQKETLSLSQEQKQLLEVYYQNFVRAGALLSPSDQETLKKINARLAELETNYEQSLLRATQHNALPIPELVDLEGFDQAQIALAAQEAVSRHENDVPWLIPLQNTLQQPALGQLDMREIRQALYEKSKNRASLGDGDDTRAIIRELAQLRAEKAALFHYPHYASYILSDQMAKTPEKVEHFIAKLAPAILKEQKKEEQALQKEIDQECDGKEEVSFALMPWDWSYYTQKIRQRAFDLNEAQLRPYFELHHVLEEGVFYAAHRLYGVNFYRRDDLPRYHPDVMIYEVKEEDGTPLGLIYFDYFKRDQKSGGAWMSNFVTESTLLGTKPVIYNVANFQKAAEGAPQLLSLDEVITMFHEFGHALHGLFATQTYPSLSGTNVARDFVEFPSQFNEYLALEPEILSHYAQDYRTGLPLDDKIIQKIRALHGFNQGFSLGEILAASELDLSWHQISSGDVIGDVESFEKKSLAKTGLETDKIPPRYNSPIFLHIWSNGYAAGYYAYLWSEMLARDASSWFRDHGGLTRKNGQYFRDKILSQGHVQEYDVMFRDFYGKDPEITPLLKQRGLGE